jgi:hypothetical protein
MNTLRQLLFSLSVISLGLVVAGTKACQEDYDLGSKTKVSETPTSDPNDDDDKDNDGNTTDDDDSTDDDTDDNDDKDGDSSTGNDDNNDDSTDNDNDNDNDDNDGSTDNDSDSDSDDNNDDDDNSTLRSATVDQAHAMLGEVAEIARTQAQKQGEDEGGNWLGSAFLNGPVQGADSSALDSDRDGFTDQVEREVGSDSQSSQSFPRVEQTVSFVDRLKSFDSDNDGALVTDEKTLGLNPTKADSDGDGCPDGIEIVSDSNPLDALDVPLDTDGDCVADKFEKQFGSSLDSRDTDSDQLEDGEELIYGTDPTSQDSDGDGILDGYEIKNRFDPVVPHRVRR